MLKRVISMILCLAMVLPMVPVGARAVEEVKGDFLQKIDQISWDDQVPEGYTAIYDEAGLRAIEEDPAGLYILMEDIELENFAPLLSPSNPFTGVLEGNGHTISGITLSHIGTGGKTYHWGLFACIKDARIANLKISGKLELDLQDGTYNYDSGIYYMGGLAGKAVGSCNIINCVNDVDVIFKSYKGFADISIGGLIGHYESDGGTTNIRQCRNMAQVWGTGHVAGILASCYLNIGVLNITNCENNGTILGESDTYHNSDPQVAGIASELESINAASVRIFACKNTGKLLAQGTAAGIFHNTNKMKNATVTVDSCANTGEIVSEGGSSGIGYAVSAVTTVQDCINMGQVYTQVVDLEKGIEAYGTGTAGGGTGTATYSINCCAGIAITLNGTLTRCINVGKNTCEGKYKSAIVDNIIYKESEVKKHLIDCYWLDDGSTNTLYNYTLSGTVTELVNQGKLTAEQMTKEETFEGFSFPDVWTMDEDLKHPYPTALLELTLDNLYQETYITDTAVFAADSVRYKKIMGGSGDGSFAGILGDTYRKNGQKDRNDFWSGIQTACDLVNYNVKVTNYYDILLTDLLTGVVSRNTEDGLVTSSVLNNISVLLTTAGQAMDAGQILQARECLKAMGEMKTIFGSPDLPQTLKKLLPDVPFEKMGEFMKTAGGVVDILGAGAAGCEDYWEAFEFYVLCNAYNDVITDYGDLFMDAAYKVTQRSDVEKEEGSKLFQSANDFVGRMSNNLDEEYGEIYKAMGKSIGGVTATGGLVVMEQALKLDKICPIYGAIKGGLTMGTAFANSLTNMDKIVYYGNMLDMSGIFAKGLFDEVQARHSAFAHSQSYEDAQALNLASNLYLNLQIQACSYAIGYTKALLSANASKILQNEKEREELTTAKWKLEHMHNDLLELQINGKHVNIGKDGSLNGFMAFCPVTVTVSGKDGTQIARLATGEITEAEGYQGNYYLLGDNGEHKGGFYDPTKHTLTVTGEDTGTMTMLIYTRKEDKTYNYIYRDIPVEKDCRYEVTEEKITGEKADGTPVEFTPEKDNSEPHVHEYKKSGGASCTEAGTATYACSCGDSYTKEEKALGHNYVDGICSRCKEPEPVSDSDVTRIYGETRFRTAITAAEALKGMLGVDRFNSIILASGTSFADALAGSYLAAVKGAPILLSTAKSDSANLEYIVNNLAPGGMVYILGGTAAVSESIENLLMEMGIPSKRLSGNNRYQTNLKILEEAGFAGGEILVATGQEFADSLSASATGKPILLVSNKWSALSREYVDYLSGKNCSFTIIGGTGAVNAGIEQDLRSYGNVVRIYGSTRQETAVEVAKKYFGTPDTAFLAYSRNFPDGLCGGPLAYAKGAPLLLVNEGKEAAAAGYVAEKEIRKGYVMGGTAVVSDASVKKVFP